MRIKSFLEKKGNNITKVMIAYFKNKGLNIMLYII